ncbi:uncharacterized protein At2g27730, mitochondrial [Momordica charantia]|uniref:Uncharacterized protein At2g27730, mitochondrial n=1 Tax=Momordica charantia TaxID=3673 RepID=A0A6J1CMV3_MOMCH|nr:uncharacterized protein At2g27730, mitochondrial [Momordica charantia]XP_022142662.1 uncharacterized protein At2g27730, mitochondrial [Momordica charantia]
MAAARTAARIVSRRFSSSGKILSEEEKAAENVYIKKTEQEKLEKLARKGPKPEEKPGGSAADSIPSGSASASASGASAEKISTDKHRNYAVVAGTVTILGAVGWYLKSKKKPEEVQD